MIRKYSALGLLALALAGCGGEKTVLSEGGQCDLLDGRIYYTETLEVGGLSIEGPQVMHWNVQFADGLMTYRQTDTVESVEYSCVDGVVTSPSAEEIEFSSDLATVSIKRFGGSWEYQLGKAQPDYSPCGEVEGRSYAQWPANGDALVAPPPTEITRVSFGAAQSVDIVYASGEELTGIYECSSDSMHIHRSEKDLAPITVEVNRHGIDVTLNIDGRTVTLPEETDTVFCPAIYDPVCSVRLQSVQCLVAPCPAGFYETASSMCDSNAKGLLYQYDGECGDLEGQPYFEPVACTKEYNPQCAAVISTEPCGTVPCPRQVHKTFGNPCEATAAQAMILSDGECGKLEGSPVLDSIDGPCTLEYAPLCGKVNAGIVCVTTPCPGHQYETFGNQCAADRQLATVAFAGECGNLEGVLADGQPPVEVTTDFPKSEKLVNVISSSIEGDLLTVKLGYSGCDEQHIRLLADPAFLESNPVQMTTMFVPLVNDACEAYFTTEFSYDLLPVKHAWQNSYGAKSGSVILRELGTYSF